MSKTVRKKPTKAIDANGEARLIFPGAYKRYGYTSSDTSPFNDRDIPSAVRELIQNSLDAAMEIKRPTAIVHFSVEEHPITSIPGLPEYKEAFESTRRDSRHGSQAKDIIDSIAEALKHPTAPFLFVEDNGVGLNSKRMDALNGDGISEKDGEQAIGSYGNGHLTVFCMSQFRYILYGGMTSDGNMISSGHAMLAGHYDKARNLKDKDGLYAVKLSNNQDESTIYPQNEDICPLIKNRLKKMIRNGFKSGSMVAIPGFNYFGEGKKKTIDEDIKKVAALNFFPAIHEGNLEIRISENGKTTNLTKEELDSYIKQQQSEKRAIKVNFPTGSKAAASYQSLLKGSSHFVPIDGGEIRLHLRQGEDQGIGKTRVTFCRSGMWISDQVQMLSARQFVDKVPFDALLLVDANRSKGFYDLMVKAEGQLHIDLQIKRLNNKRDKDSLHKAFQAVRKYLNEVVADNESEEFSPSDFYSIEEGQAVSGGRDSHTTHGRAKRISPPPNGKRGKKRKKNASPKSPKQRKGKTVAVRTMAKPIDADAMDVVVEFQEDCENCELQMTLDNGTDPSCERPLSKKTIYVRAAQIGNNKLKLTGEEGKRVGIILGGAKSGDRRTVRIQFEEGELLGNGLHALSCGLYRRIAKSEAKEEKAE